MKSNLSPEVAKTLVSVAEAIVGQPVRSIHVIRPRICDHCQDEDVEAHPFFAMDRQGKFWADLCNGCFDKLGCICPVRVWWL